MIMADLTNALVTKVLKWTLMIVKRNDVKVKALQVTEKKRTIYTEPYINYSDMNTII
jgi:ribosomal protein S28E/S33